MGGGDLLNLLIERDVFEEDFTRFYVSEVDKFFHIFFLHEFTRFQMILAIESCHRHGFIHRDIKPDVCVSFNGKLNGMLIFTFLPVRIFSSTRKAILSSATSV